jgi:hypothetical protein
MPRACASDIRQGIRGIGYNQYHRAGRRAHDTRNDVAIDFGVLVQEPQSAFGVIAVRGAPRLLVDTGSNHHQRCICQIVVIPIDNCRLGTKR